MSVLRNFRGAIAVSLISLAAGFFYGGLTSAQGGLQIAAALSGLFLTFILGVLEFVFSFDNAIVNAKYVVKLDSKWQRWFLTWGLLIAVFGMRLIFPLVVVGLTAHLMPWDALQLAFAGGDEHTPGTYANEMLKAHPAVAAFGAMFLLNLALDWITDPEKDEHWLSWIERPLARIGKLDQVSTIVSLVALAFIAKDMEVHEGFTVMFAGTIGIALYKVVNALNGVLEAKTEADEESSAALLAAGVMVKQTGRAALMTVLFLEVLDASFSFDGVIGAFAITSDPVIILLGLGFIGAIWVRSMTVFFVKNGTLDAYRYLEHGAHWSIGVLALVLLATINHPVPEWFTGLIGIVFIVAAAVTSVMANKREANGHDGDGESATSELTNA